MIKSKHRICTECGKIKSWTSEARPCLECHNKLLREAAKEFYTICPGCNEKIYFKYSSGVSRAKKREPKFCSHCKNYKGIAEANGTTVKQIRDSIPEFRKYSIQVRCLTVKQPLHLLENYEKRGRYSYHIDHIKSIWNGYLNNVPAETIANINNLQMLWWKDNLSKGSK